MWIYFLKNVCFKSQPNHPSMHLLPALPYVMDLVDDNSLQESNGTENSSFPRHVADSSTSQGSALHMHLMTLVYKYVMSPVVSKFSIYSKCIPLVEVFTVIQQNICRQQADTWHVYKVS